MKVTELHKSQRYSIFLPKMVPTVESVDKDLTPLPPQLFIDLKERITLPSG